MEKKVEVRFSDEQHVWIEGKQFIRLDRFLAIKQDKITEMEIMSEEIDRLNKDNQTLREYVEYLGRK
jgi:hypothetical protein